MEAILDLSLYITYHHFHGDSGRYKSFRYGGVGGDIFYAYIKISISKYIIFHPSAVNGGAAGALSLIAEHELKLLYKSACYILLQNACAMLKCL